MPVLLRADAGAAPGCRAKPPLSTLARLVIHPAYTLGADGVRQLAPALSRGMPPQLGRFRLDAAAWCEVMGKYQAEVVHGQGACCGGVAAPASGLLRRVCPCAAGAASEVEAELEAAAAAWEAEVQERVFAPAGLLARFQRSRAPRPDGAQEAGDHCFFLCVALEAAEARRLAAEPDCYVMRDLLTAGLFLRPAEESPRGGEARASTPGARSGPVGGTARA